MLAYASFVLKMSRKTVERSLDKKKRKRKRIKMKMKRQKWAHLLYSMERRKGVVGSIDIFNK